MLATDHDAAHPVSSLDPPRPTVVGELMTRQLITATPELRVDDARHLMRRKRVHHLIVLDGDHLLGLVDDRALWEWSRGLGPARLAEVVQPPRCVCTPETPLRVAAHEMLRQGCDAAIVLDRGRPVGLFTSTDALGYLAKARSSHEGLGLRPR